MKKLVKRDVRKEDIQVLTISKDEMSNKSIFRWIHSREFRYKGMMFDLISGYDVVEYEDSFVFTVINDHKEEQLIKEFVDSMNGGPFKTVLNKFKQFVFDGLFNIIQNSILYQFIKTSNFIFTMSIITNYSEIDTPPPKFIQADIRFI